MINVQYYGSCLGTLEWSTYSWLESLMPDTPFLIRALEKNETPRPVDTDEFTSLLFLKTWSPFLNRIPTFADQENMRKLGIHTNGIVALVGSNFEPLLNAKLHRLNKFTRTATSLLLCHARSFPKSKSTEDQLENMFESGIFTDAFAANLADTMRSAIQTSISTGKLQTIELVEVNTTVHIVCDRIRLHNDCLPENFLPNPPPSVRKSLTDKSYYKSFLVQYLSVIASKTINLPLENILYTVDVLALNRYLQAYLKNLSS